MAALNSAGTIRSHKLRTKVRRADASDASCGVAAQRSTRLFRLSHLPILRLAAKKTAEILILIQKISKEKENQINPKEINK